MCFLLFPLSCNLLNFLLQTMSTGDIVITKVYFPEGQALSSQVQSGCKLGVTGWDLAHRYRVAVS